MITGRVQAEATTTVAPTALRHLPARLRNQGRPAEPSCARAA